MKLLKEQSYTIFLALLSLFILLLLWKTIHFLSENGFVVECFTVSEKYDGSTSHTVDLPLTTPYTCKNFCGPTARCSVTGQQCFADVDCPGCQPPQKNQETNTDTNTKKNVEVPGTNDAGKLTTAMPLQYSPLTSGYGTRELYLKDTNYDSPAQPNLGVDTWGKSFNEGQVLFNKRYKPNNLAFMPNYRPQYTATGQFVTDGPLPSNYD